MEVDAKNFVESGRPKSAQNSTSNDWHISAEKERRVFRDLEPSELDKDEGEAFHKGIHTWTTELKALPNITNEKIYEYLVSEKTNNFSKGAVKHKVAGYQLFKEGYVKGVKVQPNVNANVVLFIVKSFVVASMKKCRYVVYIHLCQTIGNIQYAKCSCKAGAGGVCKHVAAVLYQLVEYWELCLTCVPHDKACTDVLQTWHVPGEAANDQPVLFSDLRFIKEDIKKDINGLRKRTFVTGNREFCATPLFAHETSRDKLQKLSANLYSLGQGLVLAELLKGNNYEPSSFYTTSITKLQEAKKSDGSTSLRSTVIEVLGQLNGNAMVSNLTDKQQEFVKSYLEVKNSNVFELEKKTLLQSLSFAWYEERKKRLTASNFGLLIKRRQGIYPKAILQKLKNKKFKSVACEWGKDNENRAINSYECASSTDSAVEKAGLIVNPKWPWLGASPDGILKKDGKIIAIEVKCPYSKRNMSIKEACTDIRFFLHYADNEAKLKQKHNYFYQCQGIMAITEIKEIDFVVFTSSDLSIETTEFQKDTW